MNPGAVLSRLETFEAEGASTALPALDALFARLEDTYHELYLQPQHQE
jgi:hypothetical protein